MNINLYTKFNIGDKFYTVKTTYKPNNHKMKAIKQVIEEPLVVKDIEITYIISDSYDTKENITYSGENENGDILNRTSHLCFYTLADAEAYAKWCNEQN